MEKTNLTTIQKEAAKLGCDTAGLQNILFWEYTLESKKKPIRSVEEQLAKNERYRRRGLKI